MSERDRAHDPEGPEDPDDPEDPAPLEPDGPQPAADAEGAEVGFDDVAETMPGAGRLNEDVENPGTSDPDDSTI